MRPLCGRVFRVCPATVSVVSERKRGVQDRSREVRAGLGKVFIKVYRGLSRGVRRSRSLPDGPRARARWLWRTSRAAS